MRLDLYSSQFDRGRSFLIELCWWFVSLFVESRLPGSEIRLRLLQLFGAKIGVGVVLKPRLRVKFPWRLTIGDFSWIGEGVWIDNLSLVSIGSNSCVSQDVYFCTGSHDWGDPFFSLRLGSITLGDGCWICARSSLGPGVKVGDGAVVLLGSVVVTAVESDSIVQGNPASFKRPRPSHEIS